jgi:hypothetical protein
VGDDSDDSAVLLDLVEILLDLLLANVLLPLGGRLGECALLALVPVFNKKADTASSVTNTERRPLSATNTDAAIQPQAGSKLEEALVMTFATRGELTLEINFYLGRKIFS